MHPAVIFVKFNGIFKPIPTDEVLYISANRNYSEISTISGGTISICVPIGEVEKQLLENLFCRIHKSYIISIQQISGFTYHKVSIAGKELPLGKTYFESFMSRTVRIQCSRDRQIEEQIRQMTAEEYLKKFRKPGEDDAFL